MSTTSVLKLSYLATVRRSQSLQEQRIVELRLRSGRIIYARTNTSDIETVIEVFGRDEYGCLEEIDDLSVVLDLGANIGVASIYFCECFQIKKIVAVEADMENFAILTKNLDQLRSFNIEVFLIESAVWSHSDGVLFSKDDADYWSRRVVRDNETNSVKVRSLTINELVSEFRVVFDLVKMDIEGAEMEVIQSITLHDQKSIRYLATEFHDDHERELIVNQDSRFGLVTRSGGVDLFRVNTLPVKR